MTDVAAKVVYRRRSGQVVGWRTSDEPVTDPWLEVAANPILQDPPGADDRQPRIYDAFTRTVRLATETEIERFHQAEVDDECERKAADATRAFTDLDACYLPLHGLMRATWEQLQAIQTGKSTLSYPQFVKRCQELAANVDTIPKEAKTARLARRA